jgi:PAS domain S-box-containing protein
LLRHIPGEEDDPADEVRVTTPRRRRLPTRHREEKGRRQAAGTTRPAGAGAQAATLLAFSRIVGGETDFVEALRQACRELAKFTGAETVSVHLLHHELHMLVPSAAYHVPKEMLPTLMATTLPVTEQGFRESVFGRGGVAWSDDVPHDPRFAYRLFREFSHRSGAVIPIVLDDEIAGAFYLVWWKAPRCFDEAELRTLLGIGRQVALLLRVKRLLRESQERRREVDVANERYQTLLERNLAGVLLTRRDGTILSCNEALGRLLRYESGENLVGLNVKTLYVEPETREALIGGLQPGGAVNDREVAWRRRDGTTVWLRGNLRRREDGDFEGILIDVSDRKLLEATERQAAELRAVAKLANTAAHEINNPLAIILGQLTLLAHEQGGTPRIDRALAGVERIRDIVARMNRITRLDCVEGSPDLPPMLDIRKSSD